MESDKFHDACGIFGIYGHPEAAKLTYLGLFALQHRGQESAGIVTSNGSILFHKKGIGLLSEVFRDRNFENLPGTQAIGHVRYSTTGANKIENAQPLTINYVKGQLAIAHNGNLTNTKILKKRLEMNGHHFQSTSDSEVITNLIVSSKYEDLIDSILNTVSELKGAYSLLLLTPSAMIGLRDPLGIRPLCLGKLDDSYVIASETCALDIIGAKFFREIIPGEIVVIDDRGITSHYMSYSRQYDLFEGPSNGYTQCIFELIYFARPDSIVFGESVYEFRKKIGYQLAVEQPINADMIIPIPDSGISAALGYATELKIPYELGLIRNLYLGRTFINPKQVVREEGVQMKLNPIKNVIEGKRIIVIDDSIVRGTTCKKIITLLRQEGALSIHLRISSPPIKYPCFYGIDTPTTEELIAANNSLSKITNFLGVDSLAYLSIEGMLNSVSKSRWDFCTACFSGDYPIK